MASRQLVVRISAELAQDLERHMSQTRARRSDVVPAALRAYLRPAGMGRRKAADRAGHLLGSLESGQPDLAENVRRYVLESLRRGG
jgi:hypothetical protein